MRRLFAALLAALAVPAVLLSEPTSQSRGRPNVPTASELERLHLRLAWRTRLPVEGALDGLRTIQPAGNQIFVQTRLGLLVALDAATGETRWVVRPSNGRLGRVEVQHPVGYNRKQVFVATDSFLVGYDRRTGQRDFAVSLPSVPVSRPVADAERVYVPLTGNRVMAFVSPQGDLPAAAPGTGLPPVPQLGAPAGPAPSQLPPAPPPPPPASLLVASAPDSSFVDFSAGQLRSVTPSLQATHSVIRPYRLDTGESTPSLMAVRSVRPPYNLPGVSPTPSLSAVPRLSALKNFLTGDAGARLAWEYSANLRFDQEPQLTSDVLVLLSASRQVVALSRDAGRPVFNYQTDAAVSGPAGRYGDTTYLPTADNAVVALDLNGNRLLWRAPTPGLVQGRPLVTDDELFVSVYGAGVVRMARATGQTLWVNPNVDRVLSVGPSLVYALADGGNMVVLERSSGLPLATWTGNTFPISLTNDNTDRLYLAGNDGLLIAMHDAGLPRAVRLREREPSLLADRKGSSALQPTPTPLPPMPGSPGSTETPETARPAPGTGAVPSGSP